MTGVTLVEVLSVVVVVVVFSIFFFCLQQLFLCVPNDEIILAHPGLALHCTALLVCRHLRDPLNCSVSLVG